MQCTYIQKRWYYYKYIYTFKNCNRQLIITVIQNQGEQMIYYTRITILHYYTYIHSHNSLLCQSFVCQEINNISTSNEILADFTLCKGQQHAFSYKGMAVFIIDGYHFPYNFSKNIYYWRNNSRTPRNFQILLNFYIMQPNPI